MELQDLGFLQVFQKAGLLCDGPLHPVVHIFPLLLALPGFFSQIGPQAVLHDPLGRGPGLGPLHSVRLSLSLLR